MSPHPSGEGRGTAGDWRWSGSDVAVLMDRDNLEITWFVERSLNILSSRFHDQLRSQPHIVARGCHLVPLPSLEGCRPKIIFCDSRMRWRDTRGMHERDSRQWEVRQKVVPTLAQPLPLLIFAAATNKYYWMYIGACHDNATTTSSMRSSPILDKEHPQSLECSRLRNQHQCFKLTYFPPPQCCIAWGHLPLLRPLPS